MKNRITSLILSLNLMFSLLFITSCSSDNGSSQNSDDQKEKIELIIDTDVGADCDDMLALAYAAYAEEKLNAEVKAITYSNGAQDGIATIRAFYRSINRKPPIIGNPCKQMKAYDNYCKEIADKFATEQDYYEAQDAVSVLRQALADSESVTICSIGSLTNISTLLDSQADEISDLSGAELLEQKCEKLVIMAGKFENQEEKTPEWNITLDIQSAQHVINDSSVPIFFIPYELGYNVISGKSFMDKYGESNPLSLSYILYPGVIEENGRHSWDPFAVFFAVEGCQDYLFVGEECKVTVKNDGRISIDYDTDGQHYVLMSKENVSAGKDGKYLLAAYLEDCAISLYDSLEQ